MKKLMFAVAVLLSVGAGSAMAQSYSHAAPPSNNHIQSNTN
jgi:hypothetical protein